MELKEGKKTEPLIVDLINRMYTELETQNIQLYEVEAHIDKLNDFGVEAEMKCSTESAPRTIVDKLTDLLQTIIISGNRLKEINNKLKNVL